MTGLKLGPIDEDKPVKVTLELPSAVWRDLEAYAAILGKASGASEAPAPGRLIAPMLARFMATDRGFAKMRREAEARR